jgi:2,3-diketo-5-methylthio-1-phosphopentane phosphatase
MKNSTTKPAKRAGQKKPIIFCDFDGTITQLDVTDQILSQHAHPAWREVEQEWACGSIGSQECLERQTALVDASTEELNALIDAVPVDPGFPRFLRWLEDSGFAFYVVSDGFDYVIRRVLKRAGVNGQLHNGGALFANALSVEGRRAVASFPNRSAECEHGCATCKPVIMRRLSRAHGPVVFVGDGLSDRYAVAEADLVLAKHQLLAYCRGQGIACTPFDTFDDVVEATEQFLNSHRAASGGAKSRGPRARRGARAAAD